MREVNLSEMTEEQLISHYSFLVKRIAFEYTNKLPVSVDYDDIYQNGMLGLIVAVKQIDKNKHPYQFEKYLKLRIVGTIIDNLREIDWIPHNRRVRNTKIKKVIEKLLTKYGRYPTRSEIINEASISIKHYDNFISDTYLGGFIYIEDLRNIADNEDYEFEIPSTDDPVSHLLTNEVKDIVNKLLLSLNYRDRFIIHNLYFNNATQLELSKNLDITESRVCQIKKKALKRLHDTYNLTFA